MVPPRPSAGSICGGGARLTPPSPGANRLARAGFLAPSPGGTREEVGSRGSQPARAADHGDRLPRGTRQRDGRPREDRGSAQLFRGAGHAPHPGEQGSPPARGRRDPLPLSADAPHASGEPFRPAQRTGDLLRRLHGKGSRRASRFVTGRAFGRRSHQAFPSDRRGEEGGALMDALDLGFGRYVLDVAGKTTALLVVTAIALLRFARPPPRRGISSP